MPSIINILRGFDAKHYAQTERYAKQVERLLQTAAKELADRAHGASYDPKTVFSFNDLPATRRQAQGILTRLVSRIQHVVESGTASEWLAATYKNDAFLGDILRTSRLTKEEAEQYQARNLDVLATFQRRKVGGLKLSQNVWKYAGDFINEVELAIDAALGEGTAAASLARTVRQHLQDPEQIFRRFRYGLKDADGNPVLDENGNPTFGKKWKRRVFDPDTGGFRWVDDDPKSYHPGRGVYRSSVKNAMRLARTEINMAYRESEYLRWQQLDFVVGFRVCLSNNHTCLDSKGKPQPFTDICDELAGDYPKTFKFVGWHPQCRCYVVPIMKDYDEYNEDRANRFKAIVRRQQYKSLPSRRTVRDVPANFRSYIDSIAERSAGWKSQPYYIRDNFVGGTIAGGLKAAIPTRTLNQVQPCTEYDTEIAKRKEWAYAFGLDISRLDALRTAGNKAALRAELDRLNDEITPKLEDWVTATQELKGFIASDLKPFPELATKYADEAVANAVEKKNYFADCIAKLKAALSAAKAELAKLSTSKPTKLTEVIEILDKAKVTHREVVPHTKAITETEIITRVGGGDKTQGSCASLALAYAGQKAGFDVLDYRDGDSRRKFAQRGTIRSLTEKVGGTTEEDYNDFKTAKRLLAGVVEGKEYMFIVGGHAAIVRKTATGYEYLELQSPTANGWHPLTTERLKNRYGCKKSHTSFGTKYKVDGYLIDIASLKADSGFKRLLGYLNTAEDKQQKGQSGTTK